MGAAERAGHGRPAIATANQRRPASRLVPFVRRPVAPGPQPGAPSFETVRSSAAFRPIQCAKHIIPQLIRYFRKHDGLTLLPSPQPVLIARRASPASCFSGLPLTYLLLSPRSPRALRVLDRRHRLAPSVLLAAACCSLLLLLPPAWNCSLPPDPWIAGCPWQSGTHTHHTRTGNARESKQQPNGFFPSRERRHRPASVHARPQVARCGASSRRRLSWARPPADCSQWGTRDLGYNRSVVSSPPAN